MATLFAISPDSIFIIAQKLWWFLVVLGVLVTFHEFGHFIIARWAGVKILKFSIGFGPKLLGRQIGETEYVISAIPLGGYVKMFGEDPTETVSVKDHQRSFVHQSLTKKTLIVAAGPGFNFLLSYLIFTGWLAIGAPLFVPSFHDLVPTIEAIRPNSPADQAGFKVGDRIVRIDQKDVSTQSELFDTINSSRGRQLTIDVQREGMVKTILVTPEARHADTNQEEAVYLLGIEEAAPVVTGVMNDSPAMDAGFQAGDRIVQLEGQPIHTWSQMTQIVQKNPKQTMTVQVQRERTVVSLMVTPAPQQVTRDGQTIEIGKIGIMGPGRSVVKSASPLLAPLQGLQATWSWAELTVVGIYKMLTGELSSKNIGGPIMIASISGEAAEQGTSNVVFLIAILSINLGILNLLPIPILDGGHLLFFAFEAIRRRPLGERQREFAQQVGLVLLVCIMVFAFWNDIERLLLQ